MIKPKRIQLYTKCKCQFQCEFCVYRGDIDEMSVSNFMKYVDMFHSFGVRQFEITPVLGETFLDPKLPIKLEYLHNIGAEKIVMFTNCYQIKDRYLHGENLELNISLYGGNEKQFQWRTGRAVFNEVMDNLSKLVINHRNADYTINIHKRYPVVEESPRLKVILSLAKTMGIQIWDCSMDTNWKKMVRSMDIDYSRKNPGCRFALEDNGVDNNGNVMLCAWFDAYKSTVIGNLNYQSIEEIYSENGKLSSIISEHNRGLYKGICKHCSMMEKR